MILQIFASQVARITEVSPLYFSVFFKITKVTRKEKNYQSFLEVSTFQVYSKSHSLPTYKKVVKVEDYSRQSFDLS
jgi:hypothetical protein